MLPAHACSMGKVHPSPATTYVLSELSKAQLAPITNATITDPYQLRDSWKRFAKREFGQQKSRLIVGEASLLLRPSEIVVAPASGAIAVSGPVERVCENAGSREPSSSSYVREGARTISRDLGAIPW